GRARGADPRSAGPPGRCRTRPSRVRSENRVCFERIGLARWCSHRFPSIVRANDATNAALDPVAPGLNQLQPPGFHTRLGVMSRTARRQPSFDGCCATLTMPSELTKGGQSVSKSAKMGIAVLAALLAFAGAVAYGTSEHAQSVVLAMQASLPRWLVQALPTSARAVPVTRTAETGAARPRYDPAQDPARAAFEEALDLIHGYDYATDRLDQARERIASMQQAHPASPYIFLAQLELLLRVSPHDSEATFQQAIDLLNRSFAVTDRIPDAYVSRAKVYLARRDFGRAILDANTAYRIAPSKPEVLFVKARVADELNQVQEAERFYREYLTVQKNELRQSNTFHWLAIMYARQGPAYRDKANEAFVAGVSLDPKAPWKLHAYAEFLLTKVGDYEAASHYAARAFDVMQHPRFAQLLALAAYTKWADFYANRGRNFRPFDASSKPLERATASAPQARRLGELTALAPQHAFVPPPHPPLP